MTNTDFAESLRKLADFYEANPDFPRFCETVNVFAHGDKEDFARQAKCLGSFDKDVDETWFMAKKDFGQIELVLNAYRDQVCERVVVRTELVPEQIVPAKPEEIIPAYEKEIYEWKCPQSLIGT